MFGNLGTTEILLIMLFILIFFGAKKIPDLAQGLGKGIREFRKAARDIQEEIEVPKDNKKVEEKKNGQ
jgi:sec-independent protein translocase protein TatA